MKIVFLDSFTSTMDGISLDPLDQFENFTHFKNTSREKVVKRSIDADILITNKVVLDREIIEQLPNLKYICVCATGHNIVDVEAAKENDIPVSNVRGYSTNSVVQQVFAMAFHALINIAYYDSEVMDGRWQEVGQFSFYDHSIRELNGKTMGIYGFGTIGQKVGQVASAFGMKVLANRRSKVESPNDGVEYVDFETLIQESDIISIHSSLNDSNKEVFNATAFEKMKPSSILINTARGGLIHEQDLADALNDDKLSFACLDVLSEEPPSPNNPLLEAKNCIITPHIAWTSYEARKKLLLGVANNINAFLNNQSLLNVVNG